MATHYNGKKPWRTSLAGRISALLASMFLLSGTAFAAPPAVGSTIGNQASATYDDGTGNIVTVTSNLVQTTITYLASIALQPDQTKYGAPGNTVYMAHTLQNIGNGTDTFTLSLTNSGTILSNVSIYPDSDLDGIPDGTTPVTQLILAAGQVAGIVVAADISGTATNGDTEAITVTAASLAQPAVTATVTDTVIVTDGANVQVTKSMNVTSGPSPSTTNVTVTLTYANYGSTAATNVVITDALPTGMTYAAGTSQVNGTAKTDIGGDDEITVTGNTIVATLPTVAASGTGTVTFELSIDSGLDAGTILANKATWVDDANTTSQTTNTVNFTVTGAYSVIFNNTNPNIVDAADPGTTVSWTNVLENNGTKSDTYNLTIDTASTNFPSGTTFALYKGDGVTPFTDSNSDGVVDTGPVAPNATINVVLKATLPSTIAAGVNGPFQVIKVATSTKDSSVSATTIDQLTALAVHDLAFIPDNTVQGIAPGATYLFRHTLKNLGTVAETVAVAGGTTLTVTNSVATWTAKLYVDLNNNGAIDGGDVEVATLAEVAAAAGVTELAAGGEVNFIVEVKAPLGGAVGDTNVTTVRVTLSRSDSRTDSDTANDAAKDNSTIGNGVALTLVKEQALNTGCALDATSLSYSSSAISAQPGQCISYRLTATNASATAPVTQVTINDATPTFTTLYDTCPNCAPAGAGITGGVVGGTATTTGSTGTVNYGTGDLPASTQATMTYTVKIDQ